MSKDKVVQSIKRILNLQGYLFTERRTGRTKPQCVTNETKPQCVTNETKPQCVREEKDTYTR